MVIPPPMLIPAAVKAAGAKKTLSLASIALKNKKKKKKDRNAEVDETNQDFKDPFAAAPAKGQPVQVKQRMRKIFGG